MNCTPRLLTALCVLTSTAAFGATVIASTIQGYADADDPYRGRVEARVEIPGSPSQRRESGDASAYFTRTDNGQTRLVVLGSIREDSDNGFTADGIERESGWSSITGDLTINEEGQIVGSSVAHPYRYRYDGFVSAERFDLEVEHELMDGNEYGLPSGMKVLYSYILRRDVNGNAPDAENGDRQCRRMGMQMQVIPNVSGGPMTMTQVPVCVEWE
ncbi:hypothetical protein IQ268_15725 [Oculatella sp. LEGE 06141]|uniref:hypothetical protein n=1 Tax=Oculatella sp. LEGE 06141 TaxID=1828648 RepID=UPI0018826ED2|nr:hypothetical protein [Oculatella sp. LEGE 06141]MBE9180019.1 hypothetical protein [Oculatella sp. LEGE 06141]